MSETDDTDELILVPPDFFAVETGPEEQIAGPYYTVVDTLISQVNKLENRINDIDGKFMSNSLDYTAPNANLMSAGRKYKSSDDINKVTREVHFESTQSTPQKPQTRFKLSERFGSEKFISFFNSAARHKQNQRGRVEKNGGKHEMLHEIDQFLSDLQVQKKETGDKMNSSCKFVASGSKSSLNLQDLNVMLKEVECQEKEFDRRQRGCYVNAQTNLDANTQKVNANEPIYEYSNKNFDPDGFSDQVPSMSDLSTCNESFTDKADIMSSSSESQVTALENLPNGAHNADLFNPMCPRIESNYNQPVPQRTSPPKRDFRNVRRNILQNDPVDHKQRLIGLSNLWKQRQRNQEYTCKQADYFQKFEEETLRRQHCEQKIQQLQLAVFELQDRLVVAAQIDKAKDDAILRFHKAWEQVALRLQSLTHDRDEMEQDMRDMQNRIAADLAEAAKKVTHFENEAANALTSAQINQDKLIAMENHCSTLKAEIDKLSNRVGATQSEYDLEVNKTKLLLETISKKDLELHETKNVLHDARGEISHSKRAVELCQAELTSMKTQYTQLELVVSEKNDVIKRMEKHNKRLQCEIDSHKKIEKGLQQELNDAKELSDKNKFELRNFYQDQVEIVVRDKLKEFQQQLEKAELGMHGELKNREVVIAKSAATHIQKIVDKYSLEVKLLEEKHSEEIRLYRAQLSHTHQFVESLQHKLQQQQQKKSDIAKQLHKLMEAQWLEAMKILNSGKSPCGDQDQDLTLTQLNVLKSKSHNNVEEVLSQDIDNEVQDKNVPPLKFAPGMSMDSSEFDECRYPLETPLTSRPRNKQQVENEIQKFVNMLLNKQPGNPFEDTVKEPQHGDMIYNESVWQQFAQDDRPFKHSSARDRKLKPPWK